MADAHALVQASYGLHAVIGLFAAAFGLGALVSRKGGRLHVLSGRLFAAAMALAAIMALVLFLTDIPASAVLISALASLYAVGAAILTLREQTGLTRAVQWALVVCPVLIALLYAALWVLAIIEPQYPRSVLILAPLMALFFAVMARRDIEYMRAVTFTRQRRVGRHAFRMALACAEALRALLVIAGPQFLGEDRFAPYALAVYALVPVFYYLARPDWMKPAKRLAAPG